MNTSDVIDSDIPSSSSSSSSLAPNDFNVNYNDQMYVFSHDDDGDDHETLIKSPLLPSQSTSDMTSESACLSHDRTNHGKRNNMSLKMLLPCPICTRISGSFFCASCIRNGDFTYSKGRLQERFAEKKLKYFKLKEEQVMINEAIKCQLKNKVEREKLEYDVRIMENNNDSLQCAINDVKEQLNLLKKNLERNSQNQRDCNDRKNKLVSKMNDLESYLTHRNASISKKMNSKVKLNQDIEKLAQQRIKELMTHIFMIEMRHGSDTADMNGSCETTPLLMSDINPHQNYNYCIVEPWLPGNGDYSAFTLHAETRNNPNKETIFRNDEYRIGAGLAFTTQLLNVIANILDIRLPKRLSHGEFYLKELDEKNFAHKIAKLNANILYLCVSQNVDCNLLKPKSTIQNLLFLLNTDISSLGRIGPINLTPGFVELMDDTLLEDLLLVEPEIDEVQFNDQDDELVGDFDWIEPTNLQDWNAYNQQTTSLAGGFVSSVASLWRGFTAGPQQ